MKSLFKGKSLVSVSSHIAVTGLAITVHTVHYIMNTNICHGAAVKAHRPVMFLYLYIGRNDKNIL